MITCISLQPMKPLLTGDYVFLRFTHLKHKSLNFVLSLLVLIHWALFIRFIVRNIAFVVRCLFLVSYLQEVSLRLSLLKRLTSLLFTKLFLLILLRRVFLKFFGSFLVFFKFFLSYTRAVNIHSCSQLRRTFIFEFFLKL